MKDKDICKMILYLFFISSLVIFFYLIFDKINIIKIQTENEIYKTKNYKVNSDYIEFENEKGEIEIIKITDVEKIEEIEVNK